MRKHTVAFDEAAIQRCFSACCSQTFQLSRGPCCTRMLLFTNTVSKNTACHHTLYTQTLTCFTQSRTTYFVVVAVGCLQQAASKGSVAFQHAAAKNSVAYQHAAQCAGMPQSEACPCCLDNFFSAKLHTIGCCTVSAERILVLRLRVLVAEIHVYARPCLHLD